MGVLETREDRDGGCWRPCCGGCASLSGSSFLPNAGGVAVWFGTCPFKLVPVAKHDGTASGYIRTRGIRRILQRIRKDLALACIIRGIHAVRGIHIGVSIVSIVCTLVYAMQRLNSVTFGWIAAMFK